ncbi:MAG: winged helix-turn-helix transcriptional regulator [Candidatus Nanopelagicales bacterium]
MATILLLTDSPSASAEVLPALGLLPHQVRVLPVDPSVLVTAPSSDLLLIDGRKDLPGVKSFCRMLNATGAGAPVIVILNEGGAVALQSDWGISDFVLDTVSPAELDARIRLVITPAETATTSAAEQRIGELVIDTSGYTAKLRGETLDLTYKEFELLRFLTQHPGRVFTRAQLLQEVWGYDFFGGTRTVDVHVRRLRAKLGPEYEALISTVRNVGYRCDLPSSREALQSV